MAIKTQRADGGATASHMGRKELLEKAEEFRRLAEEQEATDLQSCLDEIRELVVEKHGFTMERVLEALSPKASDKSAAPASKQQRKAKVKYADQDGNTWSGQGRMAGWLKRRKEAGEDIEQFRIDPSRSTAG